MLTDSVGAAMLSWMVLASSSASFSLVGAFIRLTLATKTSALTSSGITAQIKEDLPQRRGAKTTTSWPLIASAFSSLTSWVRLANCSSRARPPIAKRVTRYPRAYAKQYHNTTY